MKSEKLLNAIGDISDPYIEEAMCIKRHVKFWRCVKFGTIAACIMLVIYVGMRYMPRQKISLPEASTTEDPNNPSEEDPTANLPLLTLTPEDTGMGFEACMAKDISELTDGNPWTDDTKLEKLPVFNNTASSDSSPGLPVSNIGKEAMEKIAEETANALDMDITDISSSKVSDAFPGDSGPDGDVIYQITATTPTAQITVESNGTVTILFNQSVKLPEKYSFLSSEPSDEKAENVTDYLAERFSKLLDFSAPQKALFADYTYEGNRNRSYYVYDSTGDITEQILHFNFCKTQFAPDDDGSLMLIRKDNLLSCSEKIGDYPIITSDKALKMLAAGNYMTSVPEEMPGTEYVKKTALVYKTGIKEKIFAPFYLFWVELPDMQQENGLKTYGTYYVPAVEQQYIANMPIWNGQFN